VKYWQTALAILALLSASFARAEDFETINGKEYKNATVIRVERDAICVWLLTQYGYLQSTHTVNATPNSGYRFVSWTENDSVVSTSASYTFTGSSDRALVANFVSVP
jgi:hypothetical protein